jgi:hypothetical protein
MQVGRLHPRQDHDAASPEPSLDGNSGGSARSGHFDHADDGGGGLDGFPGGRHQGDRSGAPGFSHRHDDSEDGRHGYGSATDGLAGGGRAGQRARILHECARP